MISKTSEWAYFLNYQECISFLRQLENFPPELGTDRIGKVLQILGNPQDSVKMVHVVGTNGKGSVSAMAASIYNAAGYKVGLFTSPHLVELGERIQWRGKAVSEDLFLQAATAVYRAMSRLSLNPEDWLTWFEFINSMAFWIFREKSADIAIIEAGLGGRLDSTNVINKPEAILVTPISLDHTDRLGATPAEIAYEKAGVFRHAVPVISAEQLPEVLNVITEAAQTLKAPLSLVYAPSPPLGERVGVRETLESEKAERFSLGPVISNEKEAYRQVRDSKTGRYFRFALLGRYQKENLNLVIRLVDSLNSLLPISCEAIYKGIADVRWPARFQYFPERGVIIDGSHNSAGFKSLLETLELDFPEVKINWWLSLLKNRSVTSLLPILNSKQTATVHFPDVGSPDRFHKPEEFREILKRDLSSSCKLFFGEPLEELFMFDRSPGELNLLTGSLYTAGAALKYLKS